MKKKIYLILAIVLLISAAVAAFVFFAKKPLNEENPIEETDTALPPEDSKEVAAVILHTNDVHVGFQDNIGYDGLALYKKELESQYEHVLLVDAGDAIQGAALGAVSKGAEIIKMMNRLGYDIAVPGNHEFDFGFDILDERSKELSCGYTCANFCTSDGKPVFSPFKILEVGDIKIGFVGAVTPDTFTKTAIKDVKNDAGDPVYDFLADMTGDRLSETLQKRIDETRENGADYVILITHLGSSTKNDSPFASDKIVAKLSGIDAVIDAHSHETYSTTVPDKDGKMIPIAQTGTKMQNIGQMIIYKDGRIEETLVDTVPSDPEIASESVTRKNAEKNVDPEMKSFIDGITESYLPLMGRKIGYNSADLIIKSENTELNRVEENGLCNLVADAYRDICGTQTALICGGSVRTNLKAGEITYQDVLDILPFFNEVVTAKVSGKMLVDALEFGVSFLPKASGGFPQVSGITYKVNKEIPSSVQINEKNQFVSIDGVRRVSDVKIDGEEVDPEKTYTLAITQYLLTGGDGYTMFADAEIILDTMLVDNEMLIKYVEENLEGTIPEKYAKPEGRITWVTP
ncbi:MAG: bifunctional metallophosphatase/5'-nucleotidase [Clostridiales bacterium]|nr:bifunctional metallophosphatase/5'-nucleotidase [Clostridiales bacterium]